MSTGERQLSEWLHQATPEPPRGITVEDVAARLAHAHLRGRRALGSRRWAPVLAAAGVALAVAVSAVVGAALRTAHHRVLPGARGTSSPSAPPSPVRGHGTRR